MQLENSFEVAASRDTAWNLLMDAARRPVHARRSADRNRGRLELEGESLGEAQPIALQFDADVARTEVDTDDNRVVLTTNARGVRGRGELTRRSSRS